MRDPGSNPQEGTNVKPGFLLLAFSHYKTKKKAKTREKDKKGKSRTL
jgi:hypothetical protein